MDFRRASCSFFCSICTLSLGGRPTLRTGTPHLFRRTFPFSSNWTSLGLKLSSSAAWADSIPLLDCLVVVCLRSGVVVMNWLVMLSYLGLYPLFALLEWGSSLFTPSRNWDTSPDCWFLLSVFNSEDDVAVCFAPEVVLPCLVLTNEFNVEAVYCLEELSLWLSPWNIALVFADAVVTNSRLLMALSLFLSFIWLVYWVLSVYLL